MYYSTLIPNGFTQSSAIFYAATGPENHGTKFFNAYNAYSNSAFIVM